MEVPVLVGVRRDVELAEDAADVGFDRLAFHDELITDSAVGLALGDQREHLALSRRELGQRIVDDRAGRPRRVDVASCGGACDLLAAACTNSTSLTTAQSAAEC